MINFYGILISLAILFCIFIAENLAKDDKDFVWKLAPWTIISGLFGARIYHVLSSLEYYSSNPFQMFYIWNGGLGIWGAIFGGFLGTIIFLKKSRENVWPWLDIFAVTVPLGQAIGRWGNYFNQEIYGTVTTLPWGIYINSVKHHPLFLYESVLDILNFSILFLLYKKTKLKTFPGFFTFLFLLNYSAIRFFMEFLRQDPWLLGELNVSLLIPILLFMTALFCLVKILRRKL